MLINQRTSIIVLKLPYERNKMTNSALQKRVNAALKEDETLRSKHSKHGILVHIDDVAKSKPFSLEYMESVGLRKSDLKKLVSANLAVRGLAKFNDGHYHDAYLLITDTKKESEDEKV